MAIEVPKYKILKSDGDIELREYARYLLASVIVKSTSHNKAGNIAFSILADYIFGNNIDESKIKMTSPVISKQLDLSKKIPMTAPVTIIKNDTGYYEVSFTMPSEYNLENVPKPINDTVKLANISKHYVVAITFSGYSSENTINKKTNLLKKWMGKNKFIQQGEPILARYNPPWKPGFLRRNEIMINLEKYK
jgi:effector-binding domain-containing protein